jgi:hypothetical protein
MYRDLLKGHARAYHHEMLDRYAAIGISAKDTVVLKPIVHVTQSLSPIDIGGNKEHLWNVCYAKYFKKKVIVVK